MRAVACASTGDTSAALSAYCAAAGIPSVVLLPRGKISTAQLVQPISNGALVLELDTDFDGCMTVVQELARTKDIYLANSMNSLRIEGQKTASIEIAQQLGWTSPDWIVIPGGNLGNASAVGKGFVLLKELGLVDRLPRLVVAQARAREPALAGDRRRRRAARRGVKVEPVTAQRTLASAIQIGAPVVGEARAARARGARRRRRAGDRAGARGRRGARRPRRASSPARTPASRSPRSRSSPRAGTIKKGERVVVISTAHGLKFSDFKVGYHEGTLPGMRSPLANPGVKLPPTLGAVQDAIAARFGRG